MIVLATNESLQVFIVFEYFIGFFPFGVNAFFHNVADVLHLAISVSLREKLRRTIATSKTNADTWLSSKSFPRCIVFNHFVNFVGTNILIA